MSEIRYPSVEKPWRKIYGEKCCQSVIPKETLYEHLMKTNVGQEDDPAFIYFDTYVKKGTLFAEIETAAASFKALGVKKGDIVAYCSLSSPEIVACFYALNKLGAAMMILDPRRSAQEIVHYVKDANIRILLMENVFYPNIAPVLSQMDLQKTVVVPIGRSANFKIRLGTAVKFRKIKPAYSDKLIRYEDFLALGKGEKTEMVGFDEFELAAVTFSGGTTGMPKGVMLSNYSINAITDCMRNSKISEEPNEHRYLTLVPIFASYGLVCGIHMPLCLGSHILLIPKPEPEKLGQIFYKYRPNHAMLVPGFFEALMESKEMQRPDADLSKWITVGCGGDSMSEGLEQRANEFLKDHGCRFRVSQGYGMSELSSAVTACCRNRYKKKSIGFPLLHTTLSVFEPGTTKELTYNEVGEICATGPTMMMGYLNNPEETDNIMVSHPDGQKWIHTGDLGYMDEEGFVFIVGRMKRSIPRPDGHKVYPVELENVVSKVPGVSMCACVGVKAKGKSEGQVPVIAICVEQPVLAEKIVEAVWKACQENLEFRSQPTDVYVLPELPLVGMGKIDYKKVAVDYENSH